MGNAPQPTPSMLTGSWSQEACTLAIWAYDRLDIDRTLKEDEVCREVGELLGRDPKDVRILVRSVAAYDLRPLSMKPVPEAAEIRGKLRLYFSEYWQDREDARQSVQERWFGATQKPTVTIQKANPASGSPPDKCAARQILKALSLEGPRTAVAPQVREVFPFNPEHWGHWRPTQIGTAPGPPADGGALPQALNGIGSLRALPLQFRATWAAQPFSEDALRPLADVVREVEARTSRLRMPPPPDPQALQKAKARWKASKGGIPPLDRRDVRCLCQHAETALSPAWVLYLVRTEAIKLRRAWVELLLGHYLAHWRSMNPPEPLEAALRSLLDRLPREESWAQELAKEAATLIGPEVPKRLVKALSNPLQGWEGLLLRWDLSHEVGLGHAIVLAALEAWDGALRAPQIHRPIDLVAEDLRDGFRGILQEPGIPEEIFCSVVSNLVLAEWARTHGELRDCLLQEIMAHPRLGDPRTKKHHWYAMPMARDRVISWMARKDLRLFYDSVVADHADDQFRKAFWLRYVDRVSDFRLVLGEEDRDRLEDTLGEGSFQFATMEGTNKPSAFILRFRAERSDDDLVCVEFSRTGNSLYVYDATSFEAGIGHLDAHSFRIGSEPRNLKNKEYCTATKAHIGSWQQDVAQYLKNHGIVPS